MTTAWTGPRETKGAPRRSERRHSACTRRMGWYNVRGGQTRRTLYAVTRRTPEALVDYAEYLRLGGDPNAKRGRKLRRAAFDGPSPFLAAMHSELVSTGGFTSPPKRRRTRRPTRSRKRRTATPGLPVEARRPSSQEIREAAINDALARRLGPELAAKTGLGPAVRHARPHRA